MLRPLPFPPRRALLAGYSIAAGLVLGLSLAVVLWFASGMPGVYAGIAAGAVVGVTARLLPATGLFLYRAYNKSVRLFSSAARAWILAVCYFVIFRVVACAGNRFNLASPRDGQSSWIAADSRIDSLSPVFGPSAGTGNTAWIESYWRWCTEPPNGWAVFLIPYMFALSLCNASEKEPENLPTSIYTLY